MIESVKKAQAQLKMSRKGRKDVTVDVEALRNGKALSSANDFDRRKSLGQVTR